LLGNVWRFDLGGSAPSASSRSVRLAQLIRNGLPQPVTTRPELSLVRSGSQSLPIVTIGTGRYLGVSDAQDKSVQSIYSFRDTLTSTGLGDLRSATNLIRQQLSAGEPQTRRVSRHPVDWLTDVGWAIDLDTSSGSGERVVLAPQQQLGQLYVVTNVPDSNPCRPQAESWMYVLQYQDGSYIPLNGEAPAGRRIATTAMVVGSSMIRVGTTLVSVLTDEAGNLIPIAGSASSGGLPTVRRVSWRELD